MINLKLSIKKRSCINNSLINKINNDLKKTEEKLEKLLNFPDEEMSSFE